MAAHIATSSGWARAIARDHAAVACPEIETEQLAVRYRVGAVAVTVLALVAIAAPLFLAVRLLVDPIAVALAFS